MEISGYALLSKNFEYSLQSCWMDYISGEYKVYNSRFLCFW